MYNEKELARLSYRDLQILAAQHRVPGNIKKNAMIRVILAARRGDESEVTRLLNELQQTRKKRVKKIKGERKIAIKPTLMRSTNHQDQISNRYYAHQQQASYHSASNLQIATQEEISNADGEHTNLSNYEDVHEYLVRVQRDYHFNINNNNEFVGNQSIVDLRVNEQKTIVHQTLPLDLHRATSILLSSDHNQKNATDKISYHHFLDSNDAIQTPMLLKKMLQAPAGTNLKDIAGPDGVYRICSNNNDFGMNGDFMDDSDTLTADSESNANDDIDNINENYDSILRADRNPFVNVNQNLIDDDGVHELNSMNHNFLNDNAICQSSTGTQQNYQKWMQEYNNIPLNYNMIDTEQDNGQMLKAIYDANHNSTQERINNGHINQVQYQNDNNFSPMANNVNTNHGTFTQASNSMPHYSMYNYQNDNNNAVIVNNHVQNDGDIYHNHQLKSYDVNNYYPQLYNVNNSETFNDIYSNDDATLSQQFHNNNIEDLDGFNNANVVNKERYSNSESYFHQDQYSQNCQMDFNVNHNNREQTSIDNQNPQFNKYYDSGRVETSYTTNNDDLKSYFPRWKQSTVTSAVGMNLENLLNIRKHNEWDQKKNDETLSVFCYSAPIVTPKQLIANANVCTQEKRFVPENRKNLSLKINSSQVYNDTAQGLKMAIPKNDLNLPLINRTEIINNENFLSNDKNYDEDNLNDINSDDTLRDVWAIDHSDIRCDINAKSA